MSIPATFDAIPPSVSASIIANNPSLASYLPTGPVSSGEVPVMTSNPMMTSSPISATTMSAPSDSPTSSASGVAATAMTVTTGSSTPRTSMPSPIPTISAVAGGSSGGQDVGEEGMGSGGENGVGGRGIGVGMVLVVLGVVGWVGLVM